MRKFDGCTINFPTKKHLFFTETPTACLPAQLTIPEASILRNGYRGIWDLRYARDASTTFHPCIFGVLENILALNMYSQNAVRESTFALKGKSAGIEADRGLADGKSFFSALSLSTKVEKFQIILGTVKTHGTLHYV